jgi:hypothetical protein
VLVDLFPDPVKPYVSGSYRMFRQSLAAVDARLPQRSPLRTVTGTALAATDWLGPQFQPTDAPERPGPPVEGVSSHAPGADAPGTHETEVGDEREADLAESRKHRQHDATRANKNLDTIGQEVARSEAISDAREHRDP